MLGYHLVSLFLHALSAILLAAILLRLKCRSAWLAAAIWALHPIQVESVAWISELKNTLSGACYLGATLLYLRFESSPGRTESPGINLLAKKSRRSPGLYLISLGLFICALLAKSVVATLPVVLLLVLHWKKGRLGWRRDLLPLLPFLLMGVISGLFTARMEHLYVSGELGFTDSSSHLSMLDRCLVAGRAFWFYLEKLCWPSGLSFIYPHWTINPDIWWQYLFPTGALAFLLILYAVRHWKGGGNAPLTAFLCYGVTLFPAVGFLDVYPFRYSFVANHFQYLAGIAPIALFAAGFHRWIPRHCGRRPTNFLFPDLHTIFGLFLLGLLSFQSHRLSREYRDEETLWRATLQKNPDCTLALNDLSNLMANRGNSRESISLLERALEIAPDFGEIHCNLGLALMERGDPGDQDKAKYHLQRAQELIPSFWETQLGLGKILLQKGELQAGMDSYRKAALLNPLSATPHAYLGEAFSRQGDWSDALIEYRGAVSLEPNNAASLAGLGSSLLATGLVEEAIPPLERAIATNPALADAHNNLGIALIRAGRMPRAVKEFELAVQLNPANENYQRNLQNARAQASGSGTGKP